METSQELKITDIIYREDLYPRFEPNQATIQKYSESIEHLPPIKINQANILIDGFHRWKAHQLAKIETIKIEVIQTESEKQLKKMAYRLNANHGLQLSNEEKKRYAIEMIEEMPAKELSEILSVSERTIREWTSNKRDEIKKSRDRMIIDLYLRAWNTQEEIAKIIGKTFPLHSDFSRQSVDKIIDATFGDSAKSGNDFKPLLYSIWNTAKQDNAVDYFGAFPQVFMENLLHYHTEPLDIIYDPFSGGGTTVDACKKMFRRYYCSDRIVMAGREKDIKQHDIKDGLPSDFPMNPKTKMAFLDPPYWKQAEKKYSEDADDLGNMDLDAFYGLMQGLFDQLADKKIEKIAVVISPTQYPNENHKLEHHMAKFIKMMDEKYHIETWCSLPYSTQQYNGNQIDIMKEKRLLVSINRDLVVWSL